MTYCETETPPNACGKCTHGIPISHYACGRERSAVTVFQAHRCHDFEPRKEMPADGRYRRLEEAAAELEMLAHAAILHIRDTGTAEPYVNQLVIIRGQLKALGVVLDD